METKTRPGSCVGGTTRTGSLGLSAGAGISGEADAGVMSLRGIRDDSALLHPCGINTRYEFTLAARKGDS